MTDSRTIELVQSWGIMFAGFILIMFVLVASILSQVVYQATSMVFKGSGDIQPALTKNFFQPTDYAPQAPIQLKDNMTRILQ